MFKVIANPHESDEAYHKEHGENWYPVAEAEISISGNLHERFYELDREREVLNKELEDHRIRAQTRWDEAVKTVLTDDNFVTVTPSSGDLI